MLVVFLLEQNGDVIEPSTSKEDLPQLRLDIHKRSDVMWDNFVNQFNDHISSTPIPKNTVIGKNTKTNLPDENFTNSMPVTNNTTARRSTRKTLTDANITDGDTYRRRSSRVSKPVNRSSGKRYFVL